MHCGPPLRRQAAEQRQRVLGDQLAERDGLLGIEARERRATEHTAAALQLALEVPPPPLLLRRGILGTWC